MNANSQKIPLAVDIRRMITLLAAEIYPSPFALLRENVQNSFDAILLRQHLEGQFDARIDISVKPDQICVADNGVGMSQQDLRNHFWKAGSSSKNTEEARLAGVVGTFGIGAMANFGIAEELHVETESISTKERTICGVRLSELSATDDCIQLNPQDSLGISGTKVTAILQSVQRIDITEAAAYISQFVAFLPVDVYLNGEIISQRSMEEAVPKLTMNVSWEVERRVNIGGEFRADIALAGAINGEVRITLSNIEYQGKILSGSMILCQGVGSIQTFRSGFGLATMPVSSAYDLGGVADFLVLQPTAGREALTTESMQLLQQFISGVDEFISHSIAERQECNENNCFVKWAAHNRRYDLCDNLRINITPGEYMLLRDVREEPKLKSLLFYGGSDKTIIRQASEDKPILMLSRKNPARRECELHYLAKYCQVEELSDVPKVLSEKQNSELSLDEKALMFRLSSILLSDYFLEASIKFGEITHDLPIWVEKTETKIIIFLNPSGSSVQAVLQLYHNEFTAFGHMAKDFVRNMIFPHVADFVPSATRQGAEAFLKSIYRPREIFEYEATDREELSALWKDYMGGELDFQQATEKYQRFQSICQSVDQTTSGSIHDIVPDLVQNQPDNASESPNYSPLPPYSRPDIETGKKLLTIEENLQPLKGYRCFLSLTNRAYEEKGDFFLQPHRTSVVWGGQKALFIFEHHSGEFGLYYDLQTQSPINTHSGGGRIESCTIIMKNRIFIPIPLAIQKNFMPPAQGKKTFTVRCDILHIDYRKDS